MHNKFANGMKFLVGAVALAALAACGGGGGDDNGGGNGNGAGAQVTVSGTAAKGAALPSAAIQLSCANGANLSATTGSDGAYSTSGNVAYPCIGTATQGNLVYRGVLFSGNVANFTPLTDMLAETVFAAAAAGNKSLTRDELLAKLKDATFAQNVVNAADSYRRLVIDRFTRLMLLRLTQIQFDAQFSVFSSSFNFDAVRFTIGSPLDKVLDDSAQDLQNADGSVKQSVLTDVKNAADALPTPASSPTGATGGSSN